MRVETDTSGGSIQGAAAAPDADTPVITWAGFVRGMREAAPLVPGFLIFSTAIGALAYEKGLTLGESTFMAFSVYAGASQLMGLQLWQPVWTASGLAAVVVVVLAVNMRLLLMSAALYPTLSRLPPWAACLSLTSLTDANFVIGSREQATGSRDAGVFIGAGVILWVSWTLLVIPGFLLGNVLSDPRRFGLDLIMPLIFATHLPAMVKMKRDRLVLPVAAVTALACSFLLDGYWFIVVGAIAGSLLAGVLRERV